MGIKNKKPILVVLASVLLLLMALFSQSCKHPQPATRYGVQTTEY